MQLIKYIPLEITMKGENTIITIACNTSNVGQKIRHTTVYAIKSITLLGKNRNKYKLPLNT